MYLQGTIGLELVGGSTIYERPHGLMAGIGNLLSQGSWQRCETEEAVAHQALMSAVHDSLAAIGVADTLRVQVGDVTVFEGTEGSGAAYATAAEALQNGEKQGLFTEPHRTLTVVYAYQDDLLRYVVHAQYNRTHTSKEHALMLDIYASPLALRRRIGETDDAYVERVTTVDRPLPATAYRDRLEAFMDRLVAEFEERVPAVQSKRASRVAVIRDANDARLQSMAAYGGPMYGFDPYDDLGYLLMFDVIQRQMMMDSMWNASGGGWFFDYGTPGYGADYGISGTDQSDLGWSDAGQGGGWSDVGGAAVGGDVGWGGGDSGGGFDGGGFDRGGGDSGGGGGDSGGGGGD